MRASQLTTSVLSSVWLRFRETTSPYQGEGKRDICRTLHSRKLMTHPADRRFSCKSAAKPKIVCHFVSSFSRHFRYPK